MMTWKNAREIAGSMVARISSSVAALRSKSQVDRDDEIALAAALLNVRDQPGYQRLMAYCKDRREALLKSAMHSRDDDRDADCERAAELDLMFEWIDASIRAGRKSEAEEEED
jgi:hypothetical protein